jgi:hypothetical protein
MVLGVVMRRALLYTAGGVKDMVEVLVSKSFHRRNKNDCDREVDL